MGYKLSKDQLKKWDELVKSVNSEKEQITDAIESFNEALHQAQTALEPYVTDYNGAIANMKEFVDEIAGDWRSKFDEASEGWQEGDAGQAVSEMLDNLEGFSSDEYQLADIADLEPPSDEVVEELDNIKPVE